MTWAWPFMPTYFIQAADQWVGVACYREKGHSFKTVFSNLFNFSMFLWLFSITKLSIQNIKHLLRFLHGSVGKGHNTNIVGFAHFLPVGLDCSGLQRVAFFLNFLLIGFLRDNKPLFLAVFQDDVLVKALIWLIKLRSECSRTPGCRTWSLVFSPMESRCTIILSWSSCLPNTKTSALSLFNWRKFWLIKLFICSIHWHNESLGL